jgi:acyl-homoserine lactone acylase PvdQ
VKESTAAPVVKFWRTKCQDAIDVAAIWNGKPLSEDDQKKMMDLLAQTLDEMKAKYGKTGVTWGETHFIGRGDKLFPCDGADFGGGPDKANQTETLLDVSSDEDPAGSGKYVARGGSGSLMLMFMRPDGIESYSLVCWGQNSDPQSPHFADQSEKLYSPRKLKSTWFKKDDLLKNLESEKVLTAS